MEIWKDIEGFEGYYQISINGNVKSLDREVYHPIANLNIKGKLLKHSKNGNGYSHVTLSKKGVNKTVTVHRLVATAFLQKIEGCDIINHKDFNKLNNKVDNLEWCTQKENVAHSIMGNRQKYKRGKEHPLFGSKVLKGKITDNQAMMIRYLVLNINNYISTKELFNYFSNEKNNHSGKSSIINQTYKTLKGLNFINKNEKSEYIIKKDNCQVISKLYAVY